ncbi:MAG: tetratricopeptide repeat protein [Candidatus Omnitrophota bacterium]
MRNSFPTTIKNITIRIIVPALFIWGLMLPFFAKVSCAASSPGAGTYPEDESRLNGLQKEARAYRQQGVESQKIGDLDNAMAYYQKAAELDSAYAIAYNDLGIIYEAKGMPDRAEQNYLKAVQINPNFFSAYSNLALFYENKRDLKKASEYWQKRIDFGPSADPWTERARARLNDIRLVLGDKNVDPDEDKVIGLMNDILVEKSILKTDDKALAKKHLADAKLTYKKGDTVTALKQAVDAKSLDPSNRDIDEFLDRVQVRMLSQ